MKNILLSIFCWGLALVCSNAQLPNIELTIQAAQQAVRNNKHKESILHFQLAKLHFEKNNVTDSLFKYQLELAKQHAVLSQHKEAREHLYAVIQKAGQNKEKHLDYMLHGYLELALMAEQQKNVHAGASYVDTILQLSPDVLQQPTALSIKIAALGGTVLWLKNQPEQAITQLENVRKRTIELFGEDSKELVFVYRLLGMVYRKRGLPKDAMDLYEKSLDILKLNNPLETNETAMIYLEIADTYLDGKEYELAELYYQKGLTLSKNIVGEQSDAAANAYRSLAFLYNDIQEYSQALFYAQKAISISEYIFVEATPLVARMYATLAEIYLNRKEYDNAISHFEKALDFLVRSKNTDDFRMAYLSQHLGNALMGKGDYKGAKKRLLAAIQLLGNAKNKTMIAKSYTTLATIAALHENDLPAAHQYLKQTFMILFPKSTCNGGSVVDMLQKKDVLMANISQHWEAFLQLSRAWVDIKQLEYARTNQQAYLLEAYAAAQLYFMVFQNQLNALHNPHDKTRLTATVASTNEKALAVAIQLYQLNPQNAYIDFAFQLMEVTKAIGLSSNLQEHLSDNSKHIPKELANALNTNQHALQNAEQLLTAAMLQKNTQQIYLLEGNMIALRKEQDSLYKHIQTNYPRYFYARYQHQITPLAEIRDKLPKHRILVEYLMGKEKLFVLTIGKDKVEAQMSEIGDLHAQATELYHLLANPNFKDASANQSPAYFARLSHRLEQRLLSNLKSFSSIKSITIIPDNILNYLPFEVLVTDTSKAMNNWNELSYLVHTHTLNYAYSAAWWYENRLQEKVCPITTKKEILAFAASYPDNGTEGNYNYRGDRVANLRKNLPPLAGVKQELESIEAFVDGKFLYDTAANESNFKKMANNYTILHLAMHGIANSKQPTTSFLAFTENKDSTEDNFLHAYEIMPMDLNADLVVLSACETGLGKLQQGEGMLSLGYAFSYAGAPSLVTSLWSANDQATSLIMEQFYKNLRDGMEKDKALQAAKIHYIKNANGNAAHPNIWATFVQWGSTEAIFFSCKKATSLLLIVTVGLTGIFYLFYRIYRRRKRKK